MPAVGRTWSTQTLNAVAAYLKSRFGGQASGG
jgi:hypothetical protein